MMILVENSNAIYIEGSFEIETGLLEYYFLMNKEFKNGSITLHAYYIEPDVSMKSESIRSGEDGNGRVILLEREGEMRKLILMHSYQYRDDEENLRWFFEDVQIMKRIIATAEHSFAAA